jgi:hypothetical protein
LFPSEDARAFTKHFKRNNGRTRPELRVCSSRLLRDDLQQDFANGLSA